MRAATIGILVVHLASGQLLAQAMPLRTDQQPIQVSISAMDSAGVILGFLNLEDRYTGLARVPRFLGGVPSESRFRDSLRTLADGETPFRACALDPCRGPYAAVGIAQMFLVRNGVIALGLYYNPGPGRGAWSPRLDPGARWAREAALEAGTSGFSRVEPWYYRPRTDPAAWQLEFRRTGLEGAVGDHHRPLWVPDWWVVLRRTDRGWVVVEAESYEAPLFEASVGYRASNWASLLRVNQ